MAAVNPFPWDTLVANFGYLTNSVLGVTDNAAVTISTLANTNSWLLAGEARYAPGGGGCQ